MRREFESPEQMDLRQPNPDFALNQNLKGFKINRKTLTRAALPVIVGVAAATAGTVEGFGSDGGVSPESTPSTPKISLVIDVPTAYVLPDVDFEQDQRLTENKDWFQDLQELFGSNYKV